MIDTYKIMTGKKNANRSKSFQLILTRGDQQLRHTMKIYKKRFYCSKRQHFFHNERGKEVVESEEIGTFKKRLDKEENESRQFEKNRYMHKAHYMIVLFSITNKWSSMGMGFYGPMSG